MKSLITSLIAFYIGFLVAHENKTLDIPTFIGYVFVVILFIVFIKVYEAFNKKNEQNNTK